MPSVGMKRREWTAFNSAEYGIALVNKKIANATEQRTQTRWKLQQNCFKNRDDAANAISDSAHDAPPHVTYKKISISHISKYFFW